MLSTKLYELLNEQYNYELESAYVYKAMASWCAANNLKGAATWYTAQSNEEIMHSEKFFNYILERGEQVTIDGMIKIRSDYGTLMETLEVSLAHEKTVTARIYNLMQMAREEADFATELFLQWFITEQIEEENSFTDLISRLEMLPESHLLLFDNELGQRVSITGQSASETV